MKKLLSAIVLIGAMSLTLTGCFQSPQAEPKQPEQKTEVKDEVKDETAEQKEMSVASKIEDDSAWAVAYYEYDELYPIFAACNAETKALSDKLKDTKVGFLSLLYTTDMSGAGYNIEIVRTANPDLLNKDQLSAMINECSGLGSNQVLMATKDAIYWGYPYCSAGAIPTPESQEYKDYQDCLDIQQQVADYFGLEIPAEESTLTIAEKLADFEKYSSPTTADIIFGCNTKADDLNKKLKSAGVQAFPVYSSATRDIEIYKTANPDKMTRAELEEIASACQEGGSNEVLKATDDYIIWGFLPCDLGPEADATECVAATNAVSAYFK